MLVARLAPGASLTEAPPSPARGYKLNSDRANGATLTRTGIITESLAR